MADPTGGDYQTPNQLAGFNGPLCSEKEWRGGDGGGENGMGEVEQEGCKKGGEERREKFCRPTFN